MTLPVVLSPEAEEDLDEVVGWYERQSSGFGVQLIQEVREVLGRIGYHPESYPELRCGVRRSPVRRSSYGIFYRVVRNRIEVLGIFHDRRSPRVWRRRARGA